MLTVLIVVLLLAAVFGAISMEGFLRVLLVVAAVFLVFSLFGRL